MQVIAHIFLSFIIQCLLFYEYLKNTKVSNYPLHRNLQNCSSGVSAVCDWSVRGEAASYWLRETGQHSGVQTVGKPGQFSVCGPLPDWKPDHAGRSSRHKIFSWKQNINGAGVITCSLSLKHQTVTNTATHFTLSMQTRSVLLSLALAGLSLASPSEVPASDTKAASPLVNCGCQCAPLTFRDAKVSVDVYICWS